MTHRKQQREQYLILPYSILNLRQIGLCEKVLLCWIYSFGGRGCYQSNKTLADVFMVSACTISRWLVSIRKHIYIRNPKGYHRTMWAKSHPDVQSDVLQRAESRKEGTFHLLKNAEDPKQKCVGYLRKSAFGLQQKCVTTNKKTNTETKKDTTATPPPLPAGGQAPALLEEREKESLAVIEKYKKQLGIGRKEHQPLTNKEFEESRQRNHAALEQLKRK